MVAASSAAAPCRRGARPCLARDALPITAHRRCSTEPSMLKGSPDVASSMVGPGDSVGRVITWCVDGCEVYWSPGGGRCWPPVTGWSVCPRVARLVGGAINGRGCSLGAPASSHWESRRRGHVGADGDPVWDTSDRCAAVEGDRARDLPCRGWTLGLVRRGYATSTTRPKPDGQVAGDSRHRVLRSCRRSTTSA